MSGYRELSRPKHPNASRNGYLYEHILVVTAVLGKPLRKGVQVHHVNGDEKDNRHCNLVVCENQAYHGLLHQRQRALVECGNANWKKCRYCKAFDDPVAMVQERRRNRDNPHYVHTMCRARHSKCRRERVLNQS